MRDQLLAFVFLLLNVVLLGERVSAQAVLRRPSPKTVPTGGQRFQQPTGIAVRRAPGVKTVPKKTKQSKPGRAKKAVKRAPPRKQVILPHGRSHVKYDKKRRRHRQGRVQMPHDLLLNDTDEMDVQLFDVLPVRNYKRKRNRRQSQARDVVSFYYGESEKNESQRINLLQTKTKEGKLMMAGTVHENGIVYQIRELPNGQFIVKSTRIKDFQPERHQSGRPLQNRLGGATLKDQVEGVEFATNATSGRRLVEDGSILDVMVIYTRNAMCAAANQPYGCAATAANQGVMEALINLAVQETNVAYSNSDIPTQLRLVHIHYEANYDDHANDWQTTLNSLQDSHDGSFDYVPAMRAQYGADFVSVFVDSGQYCGLSFLPSQPTADQAYSLVLWSCATGYYSFGHELAHNMGCNHDRPDAGSAALSGTAYNFGYQYVGGKSTTENFRTILSYDCPGGCERIQRFSNPTKLYQGQPLGTATTNNARWIRERLSLYANFMPAVTNPGSGTSIANSNSAPRPTPATVKVAPASSSSDQVFATTLAGGLVGVAGNIFSVIAKKDVTVTNFAVHSYAATTVTVEVWKRATTGGCQGFQNQRNSWVKLGVTSFIASSSGKPSVLPVGSIAAVPIKAGSEQCFYVTFSGSTNYNRYSQGRRFGRTFAANNDIQITEGYAVGYQFGNSLLPRMFNGQVFYKSGISTVAPPPSPAPTGKARSFQTAALTAPRKNILTTFEGGSGQAGNMFDVKASTAVTVRSMDVHTLSKAIETIRIYTKKGSFVGSEYNASVWTLISSTRVQGMGTSNPTNIPENVMRPVVIEAGGVQAFYVTFTSAVIRYTAGDVTAKNSDLQFIRSVGNKFPFGEFYPQRIFNGKLYYSSGTAADRAKDDSGAVEETGIFKSSKIGDHSLFTSKENTNGKLVRDGSS